MRGIEIRCDEGLSAELEMKGAAANGVRLTYVAAEFKVPIWPSQIDRASLRFRGVGVAVDGRDRTEKQSDIGLRCNDSRRSLTAASRARLRRPRERATPLTPSPPQAERGGQGCHQGLSR